MLTKLLRLCQGMYNSGTIQVGFFLALLLVNRVIRRILNDNIVGHGRFQCSLSLIETFICPVRSTKCLSYVLALTVSSWIQRYLCPIRFCLKKSNIHSCWRPIVEIKEPPRVMCVSSVACNQRFVNWKWNCFGTWKSWSLCIVIRTVVKRFMKFGWDLRAILYKHLYLGAAPT